MSSRRRFVTFAHVTWMALMVIMFALVTMPVDGALGRLAPEPVMFVRDVVFGWFYSPTPLT